MTIGRQVQLAWGSQRLSLNDSTYILQADDGWQSAGAELALRVLVKASTMAEMERRITTVRQALSRAAAYQERMVGDPVEIWTKTCDDLATVAEFGATWLVKRIRYGRVHVQHIGGTAATPNAILTIVLSVDEAWQRALPQSMLECTAGVVNLSSLPEGGLWTVGAVSLYAQRMRWTSSSGLTARFFWTYGKGSGQINMIRLSAAMRCYWGPLASRFYVLDNASTWAETAVLTLTGGRTYEVVVRWGYNSMSVFVDGVKLANYAGVISWPSNPETYRVIETDELSGSQQFLSVQIWPTALSDAEVAALVAGGRPAPELAWYESPTDIKARNAAYVLHNGPGEAPAALRLLVAPTGQAQAQVRLAQRALRRPGTWRMECESGTLGANTASNSNAAASGGSQARFTPADVSWGTRVTSTIAATPSLLAAMQGEYRLYLAGYDSAGSIQINQVRWRLVVSGVAGDWSEARAFSAVGKRLLLDLGTMTLPPGNWPWETINATTNVITGSTFAIVELQARNSTGSGGGTLDMDALFLAPAEAEGMALAAIGTSTPLVLDWTREPPAWVIARDVRSLEFGGWGDYTGDDMTLAASAGDTAGMLLALWLRDGADEFYPNDEAAVQLFYASRWLR